MAKRTLTIATTQVLAAAQPHAVLQISLDTDELVVAPDGLISIAEQQLKTDEDGNASVTLWPSTQLRPPTNYRVSGTNTPPCIFTMPDQDSDLHTLCGAGPAEIDPPAASGPLLIYPTTIENQFLGKAGAIQRPLQWTLYGTGIFLPDDAEDANLYYIRCGFEAFRYSYGATFRTVNGLHSYLEVFAKDQDYETADPQPTQTFSSSSMGVWAKSADNELLTMRGARGGNPDSSPENFTSVTLWRSPYRTTWPEE